MLKLLVALFCGTLLAFMLPASAQSEIPLKHLVKIGSGRRLNIVCTGTGSPTVVFLQGLGRGITDWQKVRDPVANITRECFYDRAGFGYSDPSNWPSTAENVAEDLHALLRAADIKGRVILVGHSLGGLFATLYTDKFTPEVAGLVLVDPSFAGQFDLAVSQQDNAIMVPMDDQWDASMHACEKLAQARKLSVSDHQGCNILSVKDLQAQGLTLTPQEVEYLTPEFYQLSYYESVLSEYENFAPKGGRASGAEGIDGAQENRLARSFDGIPLEVLTAEQTFNIPTVSEATNRAIQDQWKQGHDKLAQRSTRGESIVVPNSHHMIQLDQPDAVVLAIRKVISEARQ